MSSEPEMSVFHPDRSGIRQVLGDLEAEIMELVWERPADQGITVRDVFEVLYERRRLAYTTVQSTMHRLAKKRLLRAKTEEHAHVYFPVLTQEELVARIMGRVLDGLLSNFTGMTHEPREVSSDDPSTERVRRLLEEIARRKAAQEEP